jgi:intracellular septation protein
MKFLIDFFPILLFFVAYKMADIYTATGILMLATVMQTLLVWRMEGKLHTMQKVTLAMVLGFGALTLGLHDDRFIKWKPTILYAGLAMALIVSNWVFGKNAMQALLGRQLDLPHPVWQRLNISWVLYCVFMSAINAYVAHYFSTDAWMNFKLWGYAFPLVFILGQGVYVSRHLPKQD